MAALSLLRSQCKNLTNNVTVFWVKTVSETKWRKDIVDSLVRAGLLTLSEFDSHVHRKLNANQGYPHAVDTAIHLVKLISNRTQM